MVFSSNTRNHAVSDRQLAAEPAREAQSPDAAPSHPREKEDCDIRGVGNQPIFKSMDCTLRPLVRSHNIGSVVTH